MSLLGASMLLWGGNSPVGLRGRLDQTLIPSLKLTLTPLPPGAAPLPGRAAAGPPWKKRVPTSLQTWALSGDPIPAHRRPSNLGGQGVGRRRLRPPVRSPKEVQFRSPGREMLENHGCLPLSLGELRQGEAASLSHPARPRGPTGPKAPAHLPSAPRFSKDQSQRLRRSHTRALLPRPLSSVPRPRQRGPDTGRWTSRRKVSSEERGGTGRGGAGRGRRGGKGPAEDRERRGNEACWGLIPPTGNRKGGRFQGPAPRLRITTIIIKRRMEFCLGASQWAKPFTIFFFKILF